MSILTEQGDAAPDSRLLLTVDETAVVLHVSRRTVHRLLGLGALATVKCGRATRVTKASVEQFIERGGTAR